jgi:hypothetical protein
VPGYPGDSISPQIATSVPLSSFRRGSVVLRFSGKKAVKRTSGGFGRGSGILEWSATVKLRKVVLSEGCRETKGRSGFVCRP